MDRSPIGSDLRRRRWANLLATAAMVVIALVVMVLVLSTDSSRRDGSTWAVVVIGGLVVVLGIVASVRALRIDGADPSAPPGRARPPDPVGGIDLIDLIDLDVVDVDAVPVALRPGPIWRRRLVDRPDLLWIVADRDGLHVPGWLIEQRSRMIEGTDRVTIPWDAIARLRVRPDGETGGTYDITRRSDGGSPARWVIRRREVTDEVALLDHARRIGRVTIELEDSIRSS